MRLTNELEFRNVGFCGRRKTGEPGEKPSKQGRTQPTCDAGSRIRTRATSSVGGERDPCAIPTPPYCGKVRSLPHITMVGKKLQNSQSLQSSTFAPVIIHKYIHSLLRVVFIQIQRFIFIHIHDKNTIGFHLTLSVQYPCALTTTSL